jgi:Flp pilus assembly pilin Flp
MLERISLKMVQLVKELKREEGQGATEYAMVIVFLILTLAGTLGILGAGIDGFLGQVATALGELI